MRIAVVSAIEAGSLEAHAINPVKMAAGFVELGHHVLLITGSPRRGAEDHRRLNDLYALRHPPRWHLIPHRRWGRKVGKHHRFARQAMNAIRAFSPSLVYARNYMLPVLAAGNGVTTVAETHAHIDSQHPSFTRMLKATQWDAFKTLVTISQRLADHYAERGVPPHKLIVLPDAVDVEQFTPPSSLPPTPLTGAGPHAVYAGSLYRYKGVPTIIEAGRLMPDVQFHLIGGPEALAAELRCETQQRRLSNIHVYGLRSQTELPLWLWHADVLLMPYSADHPSAHWTSPMKLGEYMAARRPVIASDIPALRDWVSEDHLRFIPPDNPDALAEAIRDTLARSDANQHMIDTAAHFAHDLSYAKRAARILAHGSQDHSVPRTAMQSA